MPGQSETVILKQASPGLSHVWLCPGCSNWQTQKALSLCCQQTLCTITHCWRKIIWWVSPPPPLLSPSPFCLSSLCSLCIIEQVPSAADNASRVEVHESSDRGYRWGKIKASWTLSDSVMKSTIVRLGLGRLGVHESCLCFMCKHQIEYMHVCDSIFIAVICGACGLFFRLHLQQFKKASWQSQSTSWHC